MKNKSDIHVICENFENCEAYCSHSKPHLFNAKCKLKCGRHIKEDILCTPQRLMQVQRKQKLEKINKND